MATKITSQDKIRINELYLQFHSYAAVARKMGISASTAKKYVVPNYVPQSQLKIKRFERTDLPAFSAKQFDGIEDFGALCVLSPEEEAEIHELWDEIPELDVRKGEA